MTSKLGFVYFVRSGTYVKIGFATNVPTRVSGIRTGNPHGVDLIGKCRGTMVTEARFHKRFARHHFQGEWFHWCSEIEQAVTTLCGFRRLAEIDEVEPLLKPPHVIGLAEALAMCPPKRGKRSSRAESRH